MVVKMYSLCFRKKVLSVRVKESLSIRAASRRFAVSSRSIVSWLKRLDPKVTRNKPATKVDMEALKTDVLNHPDSYQYERASRLNVSRGCIYGALKRLKVTYKKNFKPSKGRSREASYFLPQDTEL